MPRKRGSNFLTGGTALALLTLGIVIFASGAVDIRSNRVIVNGGACVLFGLVLLWWTFGEGRDWGIGFETVTMTVAVVTAVIAILALNVAP
ncbi:hypothetical protein SAMN05216330_11445 [Bradyrhizobium sp. Ghvi]|uniref:hypothetical protein n=1 Tax=Bradyrhizobium sp. Ghvi TaxID=1855319 RepID=UPI0008E8BF4D|nr:hypothetical protein [Bradyrhizobium sp. Ghvi]SFQ05044.1 hypothetical protein SAMN05216330_11445 [Bradyrhizobium sp. Ghvi]